MSPLEIVTYLAALPLLVIVFAGMRGQYKGRRAEYFTKTKVAVLIAGFAAVGAAFFAQGATKPGVGAGIAAAWVALEGVWHLVQGRMLAGEE